MGNDLSCVHHSALATCAASPTYRRRRRPPLITIISPVDGCARRFEEPLNVGELMLAMPGHFVAELSGQEQDGYMLRSKRISALPEDRNLRALHVYYLFPKHRLNTHLGVSELRKFVMASSRLDPPPGGATPYSGYITHAAARIAPLSSPHCEEALLGSNVKRRQPAYQRQPARARTHRRKLLEKDNLHAHRLANVGGGRVTVDGQAGAHELDDRLQRSLSKPRSWEPKLETIAELRTSG